MCGIRFKAARPLAEGRLPSRRRAPRAQAPGKCARRPPAPDAARACLSAACCVEITAAGQAPFFSTMAHAILRHKPCASALYTHTLTTRWPLPDQAHARARRRRRARARSQAPLGAGLGRERRQQGACRPPGASTLPSPPAAAACVRVFVCARRAWSKETGTLLAPGKQGADAQAGEGATASARGASSWRAEARL